MHFWHLPCEKEARRRMAKNEIPSSMTFGLIRNKGGSQLRVAWLPASIGQGAAEGSCHQSLWSIVKHRDVTNDHRCNAIKLENLDLLYGGSTTSLCTDYELHRQLQKAVNGQQLCVNSVMNYDAERKDC